MNGQQIIDLYRLLVDDTTELSSTEELALANRIYKKICRTKVWEFLRTEKSGTLSGSVPYVALPTDFLFLTENNQLSEDTVGASSTENGKVILVGTSRRPFKVINFSDRYRYEDKDGYAYVDLANSRLVFTKQPSAEAYVYDYIKDPADLTVSTSPLFPVAHEVISYGMAIDGFLMQLYPKNESYAPENQVKYTEALSELEFYNANLRDN